MDFNIFKVYTKYKDLKYGKFYLGKTLDFFMVYHKKCTLEVKVKKVQHLIECNFKSNVSNQKFSSDVCYIKCKDGTLYLSVVNDYLNDEIVSFFTSLCNGVNIIKESYKD